MTFFLKFGTTNVDHILPFRGLRSKKVTLLRQANLICIPCLRIRLAYIIREFFKPRQIVGLDFFVRKPPLIRQMKTAHVKPLHSPKLKASGSRGHPVQYAMQ